MPDYQPANCRRSYQADSLPFKMFGDSFAKRLRPLRELKHSRTLKVNSAVKTARQLKMALEQSVRFFESIDYLFWLQISTSIFCGSCYNHCPHGPLLEFS